MPSRRVVAGALAVAAAALVAGALTFAAALEPGRSERDGITLEVALGSDWSPGSNETEIVPRADGGLLLLSHRRGRLLVTRGLAVMPHRCYAARLEARALTRGVRLAVLTERLDERIAMRDLPVTAGFTVHELRFAADGRRRVAVAMLGSPDARAEVLRLVLLPRDC